MKLIATMFCGDNFHIVRLHYLPETEEYRVRLYQMRAPLTSADYYEEALEDADYFDTDRDSAVGTMLHMVNQYKEA